MNRFYITPEEFSKDNPSITGDDLKHLSKVLRLSEGDTVELRDGNKKGALATIKTIDSKSATLDITKRFEASGENKNIRTTLFQGIPKQGKLETIVQKGTELGVNKIVPFFAKRSVPKPSKSDAKKVQRLNRIALEASKQSGRGQIPAVEDYTSFKSVLSDLKNYDIVLLFYEDERKHSLKEILESVSLEDHPLNIALIVGPEGGIDQDEFQALKEIGAQSVSLGERILRTETAGMAGLSQLNFYFE